MKDNKSPKKGFEYYVAFAWIILMLVGSILGTIAFIRTQIDSSDRRTSILMYTDFYSDEDISLYDNVVQEYTFENSSLFLATTRFVNDGSNGYVQDYSSTLNNFYFKVKKVGSQFSVAALVAPYISSSNVYIDNISDFSNGAVVSYYNMSTNYNNLKVLESAPYSQSGLADFSVGDFSFTAPYYDLSNIGNIIDYSSYTSTTVSDSLSISGFTTSQKNLFIGFQADFDVSLNFLGVHIYNTWFGVRGYGYNCKMNVLDYFDSNGKIFRIMLPFCYMNSADYVKFACEDRTYYFNLNPDADGYYWSGYQDGSTAGYDDGYSDGLKVGEDIGFINGKGVGYNEGLQMAEQASFYNLFGAMVDVPIAAMFSVLNFDLLGFNMADFLFALITVCIVLTVARLVLARR